MPDRLPACEPPAELFAACTRLGLVVEGEPLTKLGRFLAVLLEANRSFNLVSIRDEREAWMRHVLDSLSVLPFLGTARTVIDVGSGGGLPGLPLAIMAPHCSFVLLEATGKKADFLRRAVEALGLPNVMVVKARAETAAHAKEHRERYDLALSRGVAALPTLLEVTLPFVSVGGRALAMKGASVAAEIARAHVALERLGGRGLETCAAMPGIVDDAVLVETHKVRPTPASYPRPPGTPAKKPL